MKKRPDRKTNGLLVMVAIVVMALLLALVSRARMRFGQDFRTIPVSKP